MKGLGNLSYRYLVLLKYLEPAYVIPRGVKKVCERGTIFQ